MRSDKKQRIHVCMKPFLGYCLYKAAQILKSKVEDSIKGHKLTVQQVGILHFLEAAGSLNQSELAEAMETDTASMVRFVDGLEAQKYVERTADPNDRRARILTITAQGVKALKELKELAKQVEDRFTEHLTAEERKALKSIIPKLITEEE